MEYFESCYRKKANYSSFLLLTVLFKASLYVQTKKRKNKSRLKHIYFAMLKPIFFRFFFLFGCLLLQKIMPEALFIRFL